MSKPIELSAVNMQEHLESQCDAKKPMQVLLLDNCRDATGVGVCATEGAIAQDSANPCYDEIKLKNTKKHKGEKQFRF
ncbi:MAG: hypothetical protein ACK41G_12050 [Candidatus Thermochlorobacter sp.]